MPLTTLLLDAGNTLVFLDMRAVADVAAECGVEVDAGELARVEGDAKRHYESLLTDGASHETGWRLYLRTLLVESGVAPDVAPSLIDPLRAAHDQLNLWRRVPEDLMEALAAAREIGFRLGVVSNSEGKLVELFEHVGLDGQFECIVDSAHEGIRKPDPAIFLRACERMGIAPQQALYAGDLPEVDVRGALGAGLQAALIDPFGFYPAHDASARYASVHELVEALRRAR